MGCCSDLDWSEIDKTLEHHPECQAELARKIKAEPSPESSLVEGEFPVPGGHVVSTQAALDRKIAPNPGNPIAVTAMRSKGASSVELDKGNAIEFNLTETMRRPLTVENFEVWCFSLRIVYDDSSTEFLCALGSIRDTPSRPVAIQVKA